MKAVTILGSTGSIGCNTLDVISRHPRSFSVFALSAYSVVDKLYQQILTFRPQYAAVIDEKAAKELCHLLKTQKINTQVLVGQQGLLEVAAHQQSDIVVAAIVGAAGLNATLQAVYAGKRVLLANKESLVIGGQIFMTAVEESGAVLLPVDSEHNAALQCMQGCDDPTRDLRQVILTASGGPFYNRPYDSLHKVSPQQACNHPNWDMGMKISVDSATMMNKGLECIEARWLFDLPPPSINILIEKTSTVHAMVEYTDGSWLAHMGVSDMRVSIAQALAWPGRISSGAPPLDMTSLAEIKFSPVDDSQYPCLQLALDTLRHGRGSPIVLNAANEIAVDAFLSQKIRFTDIALIIEQTMNTFLPDQPTQMAEILAIDQEARQIAHTMLTQPRKKYF